MKNKIFDMMSGLSVKDAELFSGEIENAVSSLSNEGDEQTERILSSLMKKAGFGVVGIIADTRTGLPHTEPEEEQEPQPSPKVKRSLLPVGIFAAAAAAVLLIIGMGSLGDKDEDIDVDLEPVAPASTDENEGNGGSTMDQVKWAVIDEYENDPEGALYNFFTSDITVGGKKLTLPLTVGELKKYAVLHSVTPYDGTRCALSFNDKQSGLPCLTAYINSAQPKDESCIKEIFVGKEHTADSVLLGSVNVGMDITSFTEEYENNECSKFYSIDGDELTSFCVKNKLGYYIDFEFKNNKLAAIRLVMREGGGDADSERMIQTDKTETTSYAELELHDNEIPVYTQAQADSLIDKGIAEYEKSGKRFIDTQKYVSEIENGTLDMNSLEAKSYIYHMMLNSIDYFTAAEGDMVYSMSNGEGAVYEFATDMQSGNSYERVWNSQAYSERYVTGEMLYEVDPDTKTYTTMHCTKAPDYVLNDGDRKIMTDTGEGITYNRNDLTNLGVAGNSCLFPQQYAAKYLFDFDKWSVDRIGDGFGRTAAYITGDGFDMKIDLNTGIMLSFSKLDGQGQSTGFILVNHLKIDSDIKVKTFDNNSGYTLETKSIPNPV